MSSHVQIATISITSVLGWCVAPGANTRFERGEMKKETFADFTWVDANTRNLPKYFSDCIKVSYDIVNDEYAKEPFVIDLSRITFWTYGDALASIYKMKELVNDGYTHQIFFHNRLIENEHKMIDNIIGSVLHEFIHYVKPEKDENWVWKETIRLMKRVLVI